MKKCKNCGTELPDEAAFCANCGAECEEIISEETTVLNIEGGSLASDIEDTVVINEDFGQAALSADDFEGTTVLNDESEGQIISVEDGVGTTLLDETEDTTVLKNEPEETSVLTEEPAEKAETERTEFAPVATIAADAEEENSHHRSNKKVIIIIACVVAAVIIAILLILSLTKPSVTESNEEMLTKTAMATESQAQSTAQGDVRIITSSNDRGIVLKEAYVSFDGYEKTVTDENNETYIAAAEGLCIYGTFEYNENYTGFIGHGGAILDENGNELSGKDISDHLNENSDALGRYDLTFLSDPDEKFFLVGLPDDIKPGKYTVELYQFFANDKDAFIDIDIEVNE
ncbi:MAG: zinc ribbon domain-containing protein [Ruminococcaceae bacterium]|nr:zinc ribbon domain-containing protein [Oscillospiraceae bacterium]